jgi:GNAT superfamily N-acetyltransferase
MLQAEPGCAAQGVGQTLINVGHVSMVFVEPRRWGEGIGAELMAGIAAAAAECGWTTLSLWTRVDNERARRLYEREGYQLTGDEKELTPGDLIVRYQRLV